MRQPLALVVLLAGMLPQTSAQEPARGPTCRLGRGINLGNALEAPQEGAWGVTLKADYFRLIREAGFDTVRLPVCWSAHAAKEPPYSLDAKFAERVDWAIGQALANRLNIIVNVHHYQEMETDPDRQRWRLVSLWEQIARRYRDQPAAVSFELLNEPTGRLTEAKWNTVVPAVLRAVRQSNPTRSVIVGPGRWNAMGALDKLELPRDDRHLIVTVHFYDPAQFTHQGAPWVQGAAKWKGTHWTGTEAEKAAIRKLFERTAAWAKSHDRPIFLGEFGAFGAADLESRAKWTRFVVREAERLGFAWAYWEFCAGFGAFDPQAERWREPLKAALLDRATP
jgi:endoglucanase